MFDAQQRRWLLPLITGLLVLLCDQVSKRWIVSALGPLPNIHSLPLLGDWLNIVYSHNTGVAFGFFQNMSAVLTVTSVIISLGALYVYTVYLPNEKWSVQISIGLIVGGALGNIVDRLRLGYVVDFIQVGWWPVFNLADSAITVGAVILAFYLLFAADQELEPNGGAADTVGDDPLLKDLLHREAGSLESDG